MPRVITRTKTQRGKTYNCGVCGKAIVAGDPYHKWTFRYGGSRFQHSRCGYPKRSQLTQSNMSQIYSAVCGALRRCGGERRAG